MEATYKAADADEIGMRLSTGCALDFEGVVEGVLSRVIGAELCYAEKDVSKRSGNRISY